MPNSDSKERKRLIIRSLVIFLVAGGLAFGYEYLAHRGGADKQSFPADAGRTNMTNMTDNPDQGFRAEIVKSPEEWKKILTPQQYYVLREQGTDRPFDDNDPLLHESRKGTYVTADCGEAVFRSEQKFDSGTGWPSFWAPIPDSVVEKTDSTLGISRTEVVGKKCGGHLGHVFDDGPKPTGLRYCINSSALKFIPDPDQ